MKLSLVVLTVGKMEGKPIEIKTPEFVIGRDPGCHLRPASPLISKRHCAVVRRDDRAFVVDFGSTNGTQVNDQPVQGELELHDSDVLKVGPIQFSVHLEVETAPRTASRPAEPPKAAEPARSKPAARPAPVLAKKPAPPPAPTLPAVPSTPSEMSAVEGGSSDDDIAAMLLSLQDDSSSGALSSEGVPEGSTVHELKVPEGLLDDTDGKTPVKSDKDQLAKTKAAQANTSSAAKSILDKYLKRPR